MCSEPRRDTQHLRGISGNIWVFYCVLVTPICTRLLVVHITGSLHDIQPYLCMSEVDIICKSHVLTSSKGRELPTSPLKKLTHGGLYRALRIKTDMVRLKCLVHHASLQWEKYGQVRDQRGTERYRNPTACRPLPLTTTTCSAMPLFGLIISGDRWSIAMTLHAALKR